jgi:hypothetical protein
MAILTATSGEILVKPGAYPAVIVEVAEKERDGRKFLVWVFEVRYTQNKTTRVRKPTSMAFGPKSAARSIVEAPWVGRSGMGSKSTPMTWSVAGSRWSSAVVPGQMAQKSIRSRRFCRPMTRTTCRSETPGEPVSPGSPMTRRVSV